MQLTDQPALDDTRCDIALLERITARDQHALSELYDRHSGLVFGLLMRMLGNRPEAEEVLQDVFVSVWTKADSYNSALGSPVGWLVRIARNRGIDHLRASAVRARTLEPVVDAAALDNPEWSAVRSEIRRAVQQALAALPPDQRTLIEHAYFLGMTHSELAERFALPLGTVKTRVRTGLTSLREQFGRQPR